MKRDKDDKNNSTQHRSVSPKEFDVLVQSNEIKKEYACYHNLLQGLRLCSANTDSVKVPIFPIKLSRFFTDFFTIFPDFM